MNRYIKQKLVIILALSIIINGFQLNAFIYPASGEEGTDHPGSFVFKPLEFLIKKYSELSTSAQIAIGIGLGLTWPLTWLVVGGTYLATGVVTFDHLKEIAQGTSQFRNTPVQIRPIWDLWGPKPTPDIDLSKDTDGDGIPDYKDNDYSPPDNTPTTSPSPQPSSASPTPTISPSPQPTSTSPDQPTSTLPSKGGRWSITVESKRERSSELDCVFFDRPGVFYENTENSEWILQGEFDDVNNKPGTGRVNGTVRIQSRSLPPKSGKCEEPIDPDRDTTLQKELYLIITPGSKDSFRHLQFLVFNPPDDYDGSVHIDKEYHVDQLEAEDPDGPGWSSPGEVSLEEGTQVLDRSGEAVPYASMSGDIWINKYTFKRI